QVVRHQVLDEGLPALGFGRDHLVMLLRSNVANLQPDSVVLSPSEMGVDSYPASPGSRPVLSPNAGSTTPTRSSRETYRFMSGVSRGKRRWRPGFRVPPPLPATRIGRLSWLC